MAKPMPAAEVDVSAGLVRRLMADQHPDLASLPVSFLANGWDNVMYRLGPGLLARLPRRELGARIIVHEQRWLPLLAPRLPLPIPSPQRSGAPALGYPYPWSVVPYIAGSPAADALDGRDGPPGAGAPGGADSLAAASVLEAASVAAALGGFLGALHAPAPAGAPLNPFRGVPLSHRAGALDANLELAVRDSGVLQVAGPFRDGGAARDGDSLREAVLGAWTDALAAPAYDGPPRWLHGDLHPANILVEGGRVSGVIDFGDITAGDPASDLSVAWMLLPLEWHGAFRAAYLAAGGPGAAPGLWRRARGWALALGIVFVAHSADNPQLYRIGRRTLAAVLAGDTPDLSEGLPGCRRPGRRRADLAPPHRVTAARHDCRSTRQ
jgi:aminoglycoside phosphotransferase (APT) family kinase protein